MALTQINKGFLRVAIASDHAGFELKSKLISFLETSGYAVEDLGTHDTRPVDYPEPAKAVGLLIQSQKAERGVLICGSGVGVSVAANKLMGIRAALCHDPYSARQGVEHDDMNVIVFGAWVVGEKLAEELLRTFLNAKFDELPRHVRRLEKLRALEGAIPPS